MFRIRELANVLVLHFAFLFASCGQQADHSGATDFVQDKGIHDPLHQSNVGKIRFMSNTRPLKACDESDFLTYFEIKDNSNFNFTAFLGHSLTQYLHRLDTSLSADELVRKGNYQFSFYLDGNLLYRENLNHGAGLPSQKNEDTILRKPFLSSANADSWGCFLWQRFYHHNRGEVAHMLETGVHALKVEIRPYLESKVLIIGDVIAQGEINLTLAEPEKVNEARMAIQPIQANSGWEVSKAPYDEELIRALKAKIHQNRFKDITSLVVIKQGKLLIEEYFNGASRNTLHDTRSVGKSFASTITGMAVEEGHLQSVDQTLSEFYDLTRYANYSPTKDKVTLKSLLTMSSGFEGSDADDDSPGHEEKMYPTNNWVKFALDLPMDQSKQMGKNWDYFTAGVVVLGDILDRAVPGGLEKYADEKLFGPLGITRYRWKYTPQKVVSTAGGLQMSALDYAKYGYLYQNGGQWNGRQLIDPDWVINSFTNHFSGTPDQTAYGFLFWNHTYRANDQLYEAFQCSGNGGNKVIVFNDQPLVIVITATAYGKRYGHYQVEKMMEAYVIPAVLD